MSALKPLENGIKAAVFRLCRIFLRKGRADLEALDPAGVSKVLFLRPEKIGDMVISLPVFDSLRDRFPHIKISVLASPRSIPLVKDDPRFDKVFIYRKRLIRDIRELLSIRREKFDCILDMIDDDSVTTLFYSQLASRSGVRIGIGKTEHAVFYDFNHRHQDGVGEHIVDNTLKLLKPFGLNGTTIATYSPPFVSASAKNRIDRFLAGVLPEQVPVIGINLSAGKPNRIWPEERSLRLCQRLLDEDKNLHLIVIVAPDDRGRGEALLSKLDRRAVMVPEGLSLIEVSDLISRLELLISPDTSLIHIARSFKVPVVGLYSRATKNFRRWQPYRQPDGAVVGEHIDNIHDIGVDQVFDRVRQVRARVKSGTR